MHTILPARHEGLLLPAGFVQPFDLRFARDDLHIMAFFDNHPMYEAVEAMIRRSNSGPAIVRAILTRHDQIQIDLVNDPAMLNAGKSTQRETCLRPISFHEESAATGSRARVAFESHLNEQIVLDITSASPLDSSRGGLSDPGEHSLTSSFPIMLRGRSSLIAPSSQVSINGIEFPIPVKLRAPPQFVAHKGYFTESHHMGTLRAGQVTFNLTKIPKRFEIGENWVLLNAGEEYRYRITELHTNGEIKIKRAGQSPEEIRGRMVGDRLLVSEIRVIDAQHPTSGVTLRFSKGTAFNMSIDEVDDLISGGIKVKDHADSMGFQLLPERLVWAQQRPMQLQLVRQDERLTVTTVIGRSLLPTPNQPSYSA